MKMRMIITGRLRHLIEVVICFFLIILGTGCAADFSAQQQLTKINRKIQLQNNYQLEWKKLSAKRLEKMLSQPITLELAVQIALLNNRKLQVNFQQLQLAEAKWQSIEILPNPFLHFSQLTNLHGDNHIGLHEESHKAYEITAGFSLVDLLFRSKKQDVVALEGRKAVLQIWAEIFDLIGQTERSYYRLKTNAFRLELHRQLVMANEAISDFAENLNKAGNISNLETLRQTTGYQKAKLSLLKAEGAYFKSRENLNQLMGLWGVQTKWKLAGSNTNLPEVITNIQVIENVEQMAVKSNISLEQIRQEMKQVKEEISLVRAQSFFPHLSVKLETEIENTGYKIGPAVVVGLPIFNRRQFKKKQLRLRLGQIENQYYQQAVTVRSKARSIQSDFIHAKWVVNFYQKQVLPTQKKILADWQLQYNAMQIGTIRLLLAKQEHINHQLAYLQAYEVYQVLKSNRQQLLNGQLPTNEQPQLIHGDVIENKQIGEVH